MHNPITQACLHNHLQQPTQLCALSAADGKQTSVPEIKPQDNICPPNPYEGIIINQSLPHSQNIMESDTDELLQMIDGDGGESDVWYLSAQTKPNVKGLVKWSILTNSIKYSSV